MSTESPTPQPEQNDHPLIKMAAIGAIPVAAVGIFFAGAYVGHDTDLFGKPGGANHNTDGATHPSEVPSGATKISLVPRPTKTSEAIKPPVTSERLTAAEVEFQKQAIATGLKIAQDAANPRSLSEGYNGTMVGNKRLELANGKDQVGGFPEIVMSYDTKARQIDVSSLTITNPTAPLSKMNFQGVALTFQALGPGTNALDRKHAAGKQLEAQDFVDFFRAGDVGARNVQVTHNSAEPSYIHLSNDGRYEYKAANASDATPITDSNYGIMERMGRDVELTEISLRHGL